MTAPSYRNAPFGHRCRCEFRLPLVRSILLLVSCRAHALGLGSQHVPAASGRIQMPRHSAPNRRDATKIVAADAARLAASCSVTWPVLGQPAVNWQRFSGHKHHLSEKVQG
jgi:hypothetical protein